jgi:hypothetical protein
VAREREKCGEKDREIKWGREREGKRGKRVRGGAMGERERERCCLSRNVCVFLVPNHTCMCS